RIGPEEEHVGVVTVGGDDVVALLIRLEEASGYRFLAAVDVHVAANLALAETTLRGILEEPDLDHLPVEVKEGIRAEPGVGRGVLAALGRRRRCATPFSLALGGRHVEASRGFGSTILALHRCVSGNRCKPCKSTRSRSPESLPGSDLPEVGATCCP